MPAKKAVLIGCNYPGTNAALRGCINDVIGIKAILEEFYGFKPEDMIVMIDTDKDHEQPTGKNIKARLAELVANANDGDVLFVHYSGHGTQVPSTDEQGVELDGKDEAIVPTDMNLISDDDLRLIFKPLEAKKNVKFTFIADCCHSGSLLDGKVVVISGPKDGAPPPPALDVNALAGFLAALGQPDGRDFKNRALPFDELCSMLSNLLGGAEVNARNVRSQMGTLFGGDASQKVIQAIQMYQAFTNVAKGGAGATGLVTLLFSCLCPGGVPAAASQQQQPQQQANPLNSAQPAAGNLPEPQLNVKPPVAAPHPGAKPPADAQLRGDVGILITGCQDNETSADACPSGDAARAHGALTNAIQTVVRQHYAANPDTPLPYRSLVVGVRELLLKTGFSQNPCLECTEENADSPFLLH